MTLYATPRPSTSSTPNAHADVSSCRDELCGHNLQDRDTHCIYRKVIWTCNANRNEYEGETYASQFTRLLARKKYKDKIKNTRWCYFIKS